MLVVVAFTFIGTAFDEVLDPKLRKREESDDRARGRGGESPRAAVAFGGVVAEAGFGGDEPAGGSPPGLSDEGGDR